MYNKRDKCVTCWILMLGKEIQPRDPLGLIEMHYSAVHYLSLSRFLHSVSKTLVDLSISYYQVKPFKTVCC